MPRANPLDAFAKTPATFPADFRIPPMPKLSSFMAGRQLPDAIKAHEEAQEAWRQTFERSIADRIQVPTATTTATATTPATTPAPAPSPPSTPAPSSPVTSVNSQVGDVLLTTDDVPAVAGSDNQYMTMSGWNDYFQRFGFHTNHILASQSIVIPADSNLVMTGPLVIDGVLKINGYLLLL